jgi:hypothetical protein
MLDVGRALDVYYLEIAEMMLWNWITNDYWDKNEHPKKVKMWREMCRWDESKFDRIKDYWTSHPPRSRINCVGWKASQQELSNLDKAVRP